jgi:hypothetical protein
MREIRQCPCCTNDFEVDSRANQKTLCPTCAKEKTANARRMKYHKEHPPKPMGYTIVQDPLELGAFTPGAMMQIEQHEAMLEKGSYTQGTILERGWKQWKVIGKERQRIIPCATPQHIYDYIAEHPGVTIKELSNALGTRIGDRHLASLETGGYYISQDEDKLYAVKRVTISPLPAKVKVITRSIYVEALNLVLSKNA